MASTGPDCFPADASKVAQKPALQGGVTLKIHSSCLPSVFGYPATWAASYSEIVGMVICKAMQEKLWT